MTLATILTLVYVFIALVTWIPLTAFTLWYDRVYDHADHDDLVLAGVSGFFFAAIWPITILCFVGYNLFLGVGKIAARFIN